MITANSLSQITAVRHAFCTRNGVGETFGQRNCAYRPGDHSNDIDHNRAACAAAVGTGLSHLVTVKQRHTTEVFVADQPLHWAETPIADAVVTRTPGLSLGILTADCAPVLLADASGNIVGAAHAGWRGALDGVLENTVNQMIKLGAKRPHIVAAIGPCIGKASYEVGPEFKKRFVAHDNAYASFFSNERADGHCYFDLAGFAAQRLVQAGVGNVTISGHDTCTDDAQFFSYRRSVLRNEPDYGRQLSVISIMAP